MIKSNSTNNYCSKNTKLFDKFSEKSYSWKYIEKPAFDRSLPLNLKDIKVLDAGCGSGRVIQYLIDKGVNEANIYGIDSSADIVKIAKVKFPGAQIKIQDLTKPNLPENYFDLIISLMVFHYWNKNDLYQVLVNLHRTLKPGGNLVFIIANPKRFTKSNEIKEGKHLIPTPWGSIELIYAHKLEDYINLMKNAEFKSIELEEPHIVDEGKLETKAYNHYNRFPARILIKAKKE